MDCTRLSIEGDKILITGIIPNIVEGLTDYSTGNALKTSPEKAGCSTILLKINNI